MTENRKKWFLRTGLVAAVLIFAVLMTNLAFLLHGRARQEGILTELERQLGGYDPSALVKPQLPAGENAAALKPVRMSRWYTTSLVPRSINARLP